MTTGLIGSAISGLNTTMAAPLPTGSDMLGAVVGKTPNPNGYTLTDALGQIKAGNVGTTPAPVAPIASPAPLATTAPGTVASVIPPTAVVPRAIGVDETVAGQLNTLLSKESPYIQSARNRGMEQANSRGLINTSMAAGTSERAAIDAALPIAQQDSTIQANAGQSAQNAMQDTNLTGYKSLLDSAQQAENFGYRTKENEQNIAANTALQNDRIALDLTRLDATGRDEFTKASSPVIQQTQSEISQIQRTPDTVLSGDAKATAIADLMGRQNTTLQTIATLYGYKLDWPTVNTSGVSPTGAPVSNGVVTGPAPAAPLIGNNVGWGDTSGANFAGG